MATQTQMTLKQLSEPQAENGDSIYNYYQKARMEEAAYLFKHKNCSVSEAGYQLGFSNLSYFTRLSERHHQQKPKKHTLGG